MTFTKILCKGLVQFAFFDFCVGKHHKIMVCAWVESVKVTLQMGIAQVQAAKLAPHIRPSPVA